MIGIQGKPIIVATALQLFTLIEMQLAWTLAKPVKDGALAKAKTSICARAEHKILKMVSLIHRYITSAYLAQQNRNLHS